MVATRRMLVGLLMGCVGTTTWGCSSTTTTTTNTIANCGAGTELHDGVCVVVGDAHAPDETTTGEDGNSVDDTTTIGDVVADTTSPPDDVATVATDTTVAVVDADVGIDAHEVGKDAAPLGDPCPPFADVDCSGACGGDGSKCAIGGPYTCVGKVMYPKTLINSYAQLPFTIRLPEKPGTDPACQPRCGTGNTVWGFGIDVQIPSARGDGLRIKVNPPWQAYPYDPYKAYCIEPGKPGGSCLFASGGSATWFIATTDPKADARNATIEWVDTGGERCL